MQADKHTAPTRSAQIRPGRRSVAGNGTSELRYTVHDLSQREALHMAETMAKASGTPVRWILWLRSPSWHEYVRSDSLHEWRNGQQVLLVFPSERAARRFLRDHAIGGDWQAQPYAEITLAETCRQHGWRWRLNERNDPPLIEADIIDPETGEVFRTAWAERKASPRPDAELATVADEVARWLMTI